LVVKISAHLHAVSPNTHVGVGGAKKRLRALKDVRKNSGMTGTA